MKTEYDMSLKIPSRQFSPKAADLEDTLNKFIDGFGFVEKISLGFVTVKLATLTSDRPLLNQELFVLETKYHEQILPVLKKHGWEDAQVVVEESEHK